MTENIDNVIVREIDEVCVISINRPEVRNAVNSATASALASAFYNFDCNDRLKVAILSGEGGTFCAGADLAALADSDEIAFNPTTDFEQEPYPLAPMGPSFMQLSKPVIAAIDGYAVAGGLELAIWCDLRVMESNALLGVFCRRWGVPLVDGGTVRLPRLIGHSHAMDMILTGREVGASEALQMGLVNRVVETGQALAQALELAQQIARFPQRCMNNDRKSARRQWSLNEHEALAYEALIGADSVHLGGTLNGARRFKSGKGRGGDFNDI